PGEGLRTLDGEDRELSPEMLVIADARRPVALAGIMGGAESEVGIGTDEVLLESAWFEPGAVRRTAGALGMHTDASHRFERGADPEATLVAAARAVELIRELTGGVPEETPLDVRGEILPAPARIHLDPGRLDRFAGTGISTDETRRCLVSLGFDPEATEEASGWAVEVPSWRRFDVLEEADLMEEVLRVVGFDRIPAELPAVEGPDALELPSHRVRRSIQDHLAACGHAEAISYAFYGEEEDSLCRPWSDRGEAVGLSNPLSERYDRMRRTLIPGLVSAARFNRRRDREAVALFELGHVFWRGEDDEPREVEHVGLVSGGRLGTPWEGSVELDFHDLKGVAGSLLSRLGLDTTMVPAEIPGLVEGAAAEWRNPDGRRIGVLGRLDEEDPLYPLFVAEIALPAAGAVSRGRTVELPSRHPGITMDVTLTHSKDVLWREISRTVTEAEVPDLAFFGLKDRYEGEGVPEGFVNTTITFRYQAGDRSLTQEEVNRRQERLTRLLTERYGREERG
ncbi:MAG: phenylalanine--tRNA ligase subunit beta, partial [Thermoanaerobaculia bacterium]|nr:phenylalanine--tRNA ligase subunit beta [Thermoanaerobaculia bacterium]